MNLPRHKHFLAENNYNTGRSDSRAERPHGHINFLFEPLVHKLQQLRAGVPMKHCDSSDLLVRAALLCVVCDIPTARKVCEFVGHRASKGCSKCLLSFPTEHLIAANGNHVYTNSCHRKISADY